MRKLLIIFISLLLCMETVFPTVKLDETNSTGDTEPVKLDETNDLLKELIAINTKTDELLKEVMANKTKYGGTNSIGYANTWSDIKNSARILKQGMLIVLPAVIICIAWNLSM